MKIKELRELSNEELVARRYELRKDTFNLRLQQQTGGFGCFMLLAHEWANRRATEESYELFARFVMPHFQGNNDNREQWQKGSECHCGE